jgi:hypothetical protein
MTRPITRRPGLLRRFRRWTSFQRMTSAAPTKLRHGVDNTTHPEQLSELSTELRGVMLATK